jgi:hypothetical protein
MLAGAVEERSAITERVLGPVCSGSDVWAGVRTEGASAIVLEDEAHAIERGAKPLCNVVHTSMGRGEFSREAGASLPSAGPRAIVIVARNDPATRLALAQTGWAAVSCVEVAPRAGNHEGLGGFCLVAAASAIAEGAFDRALVLGLAPDRWAAIVLGRR